MNDLEQKVLNAIAHISAGKNIKNRSPAYALDNEIFLMLSGEDQDKIKDSINSLVGKGKVDWGETVNNKYFKNYNFARKKVLKKKAYFKLSISSIVRPVYSEISKMFSFFCNIFLAISMLFSFPPSL